MLLLPRPLRHGDRCSRSCGSSQRPCSHPRRRRVGARPRRALVLLQLGLWRLFPSESGTIVIHRICMGILCCCSIALVPVLVWWRQSSPLFDAAGDAGSGDPDAPPPPAAPPTPPVAPPMPPMPPMPPFAPPLPRGLAGGLRIAGGSVLLLLLLMGLIAAGKRVEFDEEETFAFVVPMPPRGQPLFPTAPSRSTALPLPPSRSNGARRA